MKTIFIVFVLITLALLSPLHAETPAFEPLDQRLITLASTAAPTEVDRLFLVKESKEQSQAGCVAIALLFKNWPDQYRNDFVAFYGIAPSVTTTELPESDVNKRVNTMLAQLKGRHPLDVTSHIYLAFRRQGYVAKRADGQELSLEVIFRGAVFTGITNGDINEIHRFSAIADGKRMPATDNTEHR